LILRRLKSEVAKDLPEKVETVVRCVMGTAQRALYEEVAAELRTSLGKKLKEQGFAATRMDVFAAITRLRQICCDPHLLPTPPDSKIPPSAKLALFEELMREALASDRCVVVFSQFVQMQRRLIQVIRRLGVEPLWLHGGSARRQDIVAQFQDPKGPRVIVVSLRAGGVGVTLTRADTVMHYDPWWNPAVERQATDRTHRLGQRNRVTVYRLICAQSIEERVMELAKKKDGYSELLLRSEGSSSGKRISEQDILSLLG
jgi:SNF2 family DNA or RNA helicase